MSRDDYSSLVFLLGLASGGISRQEGNGERFYRAVALLNRLNEGNPAYTPYEIPAEYAG